MLGAKVLRNFTPLFILLVGDDFSFPTGCFAFDMVDFYGTCVERWFNCNAMIWLRNILPSINVSHEREKVTRKGHAQQQRINFNHFIAYSSQQTKCHFHFIRWKTFFWLTSHEGAISWWSSRTRKANRNGRKINTTLRNFYHSKRFFLLFLFFLYFLSLIIKEENSFWFKLNGFRKVTEQSEKPQQNQTVEIFSCFPFLRLKIIFCFSFFSRFYFHFLSVLLLTLFYSAENIPCKGWFWRRKKMEKVCTHWKGKRWDESWTSSYEHKRVGSESVQD